VASSAPLLVDVEFGRPYLRRPAFSKLPYSYSSRELHRTLYALAQGKFPVGNPPGSPALPNTGSLVRVNPDGSFTVVADALNQPTSLELIGSTAYVVTLSGEIWKIKGGGGQSL
jgi:hypothetical protein